MTEQHDIVNATLEGDLRVIAFRTLREWLCFENFRSRAPINEALDATWIGTSISNLKEKEGWQWFRTEEGRYLQQLNRDITTLWVDCGWVNLECPRLGRRRVAEYSTETVKKALAIWNNGCQGYVKDSTWRWASSVLGETSNRNDLFVVTLTDEVFEEVYRQVDPQDIEGCSREELSVLLDLPKRVANHFVRYLVDSHGWAVRETTREGRKSRVLRRCSVSNSHYNKDEQQ